MTSGLAPDPAVPHREELLDPAAFARAVAAHLCSDGVVPAACERSRATYRVGEGVRVLHRIVVEGVTIQVAARTFAAERLDGVHRRLLAGAVATDPLLPAAAVPELGAVFWTYPNDRKLPTLPLLRATATEVIGRRVASTDLVAYAPEKSATALCSGTDGTPLAYAKVYEDDAGRRTADLQPELAGRGVRDAPALRLPRVLGYSAAARTLVVEPLAGTPLADADDPAAYRAYGAALAALHSLRPPHTAPAFARFAPERLLRAARRLARARPDVAAAAHDLARTLEAARPRNDGAPSLLHGDVHPKNALLEDGHVALIDLDQVAAGPAAADLGSALAGLEYRRLTTGVGAPGGALLSGYAAAREPPPEDVLAWHTAAALLAERALRTVTRVRPEGLARLPRLLARARELLGEDTP